MYRAQINVTLKKSVSDPQGQTVLEALHALGFKDAQTLRVGKFFNLVLAAKNKQEAEASVKTMCERLLTNPVIEEYSFRLDEMSEEARAKR
jgi:phosphoribosylformylglycinamidine synthase subunit PurS